MWTLASSHTMPVLPSGQGHVYPHVSRVPGPDGHVASDVAKLSLSRYSDLGQQYAKYPGRKGAATSEVRCQERKTELNIMNISDESRVCQKL